MNHSRDKDRPTARLRVENGRTAGREKERQYEDAERMSQNPPKDLPEVASHGLFSVDPARDWPWGSGDNDNYMNECLCCHQPYRGHKRSIICCKCQREASHRWAVMTTEERLEHMRKVEADYAKFFAENAIGEARADSASPPQDQTL